ncbi:protein Jumonji-like isoform X4 [Mizuhopecten yessoensis]|uniref:Protein Jumonji n=1 Tax=Mizuhopecten yessoensis TaxID=6573 RepID=A0A210PFG7_MIZYE|nr:protein Jumonji-like isoform X4 [Mizuhopecten yessoensis]OWF35207.1 Protein Jumonji [Mizuhopecten yessoensis]
MVGKKPPTPGCSSRKTPGEPALAQRLRRNISPKNLDLTAGLSWREERELNKALYASLQETKKLTLKSELDLDSPLVPSNSIPRRNLLARVLPRRQSPRSSKPVAPVKSNMSMRSPTLPPPSDKRLKSQHSIGGDESSQDSMRSSTTSCSNDDLKGRTKVRAQRKFAQMHAYGNTMVPSQHTPVKQSSKTSSPIKVFPKRAKTEDFLTFLCLRGKPGKPVLPPHLDFFNFSRDEGDTSLPPTPPNRSRVFVRESSPSSSSTSCSNVPDEVADSPAPLVMPPSGRVTPSRKAARACAGTPETARGLASFPSRQGQRSQATSKRRQGYTSPAITPAKLTRSYRNGTPSPMKGTRGKASPGKMTDAERLCIKRKAIATLTSSKLSPDKKSRRKSLFVDQSEMDEKPGRQRQTKIKPRVQKEKNRRTSKANSEKLSRKSSQGRRLNSSNVVKKKKKFKPATKFIAHRLPQRKAKLRWNSCYLEDDEFDNEVSFVFKQSPEPHTSRKHKADLDTEDLASSSDINIPLKKTRLKKIVKKSEKAKSHGKIKLRQTKKKVKTEKVLGQKNTPVECDSSSGVHTRSGIVLRVEGCGEEPALLPSNVNTNTAPAGTNKTNMAATGTSKTNTATAGTSKVVLESSKKRSPMKQKHIKELREKSDKNRFKLLSSTEKQRKIKVKREKGTKTETSMSESVQQGSRHAGSDAVKQKRKPSVKKRLKEVPSLEKEVKQEPFPGPGEPARLVDAPSFYPSEEQFSDPIKYIQSVTMVAEPYGMCKIIPPSSWKPDNKISEELRFTTQKQYIHKLYDRFGPNVCQLKGLQKHLDAHGVSEPFPVIGGVEVDICKFSAVIEHLGGMQNVIEKKKLLKVADIIGIPKSAQDRGTKLYDTYCKFLVSYDMLSADKKRKLEDEVTEMRKNRKGKGEEEDCVIKGKNMSLVMFNRAARNIGAAWLRDPSSNTTGNTEKEYWNIVKGRKSHVVVHGGHIDTQAHNCTVFSSKKDNHYYSHPWNLNNLPHSPDSLLRYLGHVSGVTVPTLHMGMAFTTSCWSTDIHSLPYVQYLHTESDTVWYSVPGHREEDFRSAMTTLVPTLVSDGPHWLREDTVMVPPDDLTANGVAVSRCVQRPGQFVVVFPRCYTSTISCGYSLAESVHYATPSWLEAGQIATKTLNDSFEPEMFSMDELLTRIAEDPATPIDVLAAVLPWLQKIIDRELESRQVLFEAGLKSSKRMCTSGNLPHISSRGACQVEEIITMCDVSKKICYLSLVLNEVDDLAFSLEHGLAHIQKKRNIRSCKLMFRHTEDELTKLLRDVKERLSTQYNSSGGTESSEGSSPRRKQPRKGEPKS